MKLQYWGTAAAEGIPAIFCECAVCRRSRALGGRNIRTRSQAMIDDTLLIDAGADTYMHSLRYGFELSRTPYVLVTHIHPDHFYLAEFLNRGYAHVAGGCPTMTICGSQTVTDMATDVIKQYEAFLNGRLAVQTLCPFEPTVLGDHTVTPLPAVHAPHTGPLIYQITSGGKTLLYGHDTGILHDDIWDYWAKTRPVFDFVSLDCTAAAVPMNYDHHMNLERNVLVRDRMVAMGVTHEGTRFCSNHFSHNGGDKVVYDDFAILAAEHGFMTSYDGMIVEI